MFKNRQAKNQHLRQIHGVTPKMMQNVIKPPPIPPNMQNPQEYTLE